MRENRSGPVELELKELPYYEFQDLLVATNNFHEKNKLGHGGFGQVYKVNIPLSKSNLINELSAFAAVANLEQSQIMSII